VIVGNGAPIAVTYTSTVTIPTPAAYLYMKNNVAVCSSKKLVFVCVLTRDNPITVEFDAFGFSIKDIRVKMVLLHSGSSSELYLLHTPTTTLGHRLVATALSKLWHSRLSHLRNDSLSCLLHSFQFSCSLLDDHYCHACRLSKHVCLPFGQLQ